MARYIDVDKFKKYILDRYNTMEMVGINQVVNFIHEQPTADAKEVVMCKDCKWFDGKHIKHNDGHIQYVSEDYPFVTTSAGINVQARCMRTPYIDNLFVKDNGMDYCSRGERIMTY